MTSPYYLSLAFFFCCFVSFFPSAVAAPSRIETNSLATTTHLRSADLKAAFIRILQVTLYRGDKAYVETSPEKMEKMVRAISSFQPSLVLGVLSLSEEKSFSPDMVEAFQLFRKTMLLTNPHCKFDVKLDVTKYETATTLLAKLQEVSTRLAPDVVTLVIPKSNEVVYPSVLAKGIEYLHLHGLLVGYEGPTCMIPNDVDFLVIRSEKGEVHRDEIASLRLKQHLPLLIQLNKSFWKDPSTASNEDAASAEQAKILTHLAEEQNAFGYHLVYPVLDAMFHREHNFHESTKSPLLVTIKALIARFN